MSEVGNLKRKVVIINVSFRKIVLVATMLCCSLMPSSFLNDEREFILLVFKMLTVTE